MTEPNSPETPETFADAIAKLRTFGAWQDNDRINAVVAAHEREVDVKTSIIYGHKNNEIRLKARILDLEDGMRKHTATIEKLSREKLDLEFCVNERVRVARKQDAQVDRLCATIAELREALRLCKKAMCEYCATAADLATSSIPCVEGCETLRLARAALEKTEAKGE